MALPDLLPIQPFTRPVRGSVVLPGSKSITNRALFLAALCDSPVTLTGALFSEDTAIMAAALKALGFIIELRPAKNEIYVEGRGGIIPAEKATLHVGLAGTIKALKSFISAKKVSFRSSSTPTACAAAKSRSSPAKAVSCFPPC